ncbi:hypothetical protein GQ53DRAFT_882990 [Thozetella sp. PMI_491]|nr:hypothetical protein GQ53DRAFT_882990 [Thozetella sp. PMI_491]
MGSKSLPLVDKGIYRNLPTFSPNIKDLTAIITGANGISGFHTLRALLQSPRRWKKVWALSRQPPPTELMSLLSDKEKSRVEHVPIDFLVDPQSIADTLSKRNVTADVVFFYSYMQPRPEPGQKVWSNAEALVEANGALLRNFLASLKLASITPSRVLLQTGAKNYGAHLGQCMTPLIESAPRVTIEPNFYYVQEDLLFEYCKETGAKWNVIRPSWIIGPATNAAMDSFRGVAVYAAVQAHLGKSLEFPADMSAWLTDASHSSAMLTGYMSEWAVLEKHCENQAFNSSDSGSFTLASFWPELASWYGAKAGRPELDDKKLVTHEFPANPPPLGYGPPTRIRLAWSYVAWAQQPANRLAWEELMQKHGLHYNPFDDPEAHFAFSDAAMHAGQGRLSTNKSRSFGWNGFVDTTECLYETYQTVAKLGLLPPMIIDDWKSNAILPE